MASIHQTNNLHLSQFESSDQPKWLCDYNKDMKNIDDGVALKAEVEEALEGKADVGRPEVLPLELADGIVTPTDSVQGAQSIFYKDAFGRVSVEFDVVREDGKIWPPLATVIGQLPPCFFPETLKSGAAMTNIENTRAEPYVTTNGAVIVDMQYTGQGYARRVRGSVHFLAAPNT